MSKENLELPEGYGKSEALSDEKGNLWAYLFFNGVRILDKFKFSDDEAIIVAAIKHSKRLK